MKLERKSSTADIIITVPRQFADDWIAWLKSTQAGSRKNNIINIRRER